MVVSLFPKANRFYFLIAICLQFTFLLSTQMIFPIFSNFVPRWRCVLNNQRRPSSEIFGRNCTLFQQCHSPNGTIEFEHVYFESAALEFGWVCGTKAYLATLFAQTQFFGVLIGSMVFGGLSDAIGRKPVGVGALAMGIASMVLSGVSPSWKLLFICRFLLGLSVGASIAVKTFIMEMVLPEQRMVMRAFFNWGNGRIMLTAICFLFPNWRTSSFATAVCVAPALFLMLFVFPESPIWLHHKGRLEDMRRSERRIAKIGNVPYEEVEHEPMGEKCGFFDLIRNSTFVRRIAVLWTMWFAASVSSYGTDLNSSRIAGNLFLNQALFSALIALSKTLLIPFDALKFSRRNLHQISQATVVICFLVLTTLTSLNEQGISILIVNLITAIFIEYTWDGCYLCAIESMPTEMRSTAVGVCSIVARIGAILSPTLVYFASIWAPSAYLIMALIGSSALCISCIWLVETKNVDLDKIELKKKQSIKSTIENPVKCLENGEKDSFLDSK